MGWPSLLRQVHSGARAAALAMRWLRLPCSPQTRPTLCPRASPILRETGRRACPRSGTWVPHRRCAPGACLPCLPSLACALPQMRANWAPSEVLASAPPLVPLGERTAPPSTATPTDPQPLLSSARRSRPPEPSRVCGFAGGARLGSGFGARRPGLQPMAFQTIWENGLRLSFLICEMGMNGRGPFKGASACNT